MSKNNIYLDNNATTPLDPLVQKEIERIHALGPLNPSSVHKQGQIARNELTQARRSIAQHLNVLPSQILFTSGATEAINLALRSLMRKKNPKIISTKAEHSCVYETLLDLQTKGADVHFLNLDQEGKIDLKELQEHLPADAAVFSYANSETGILLELDKIHSLLLQYDTPFLLDSVTWMGKDKVRLPHDIDFACFSGHKFHAPQGVGFAVISKRFKLQPLFTGGGQEQNLRSGTSNLAGIVALAKAVEIAQKNAKPNKEHMLNLRKRLEEGFSQLGHPFQIHGKNRLCNTTCVYFEGVDAEGLFMNLDMKGVMVSIGSACSSGSLEPSRALLAMNLDPIIARNSLRFSLSRFTTLEEVDQTLDLIKQCLQRQTIFH